MLQVAGMAQRNDCNEDDALQILNLAIRQYTKLFDEKNGIYLSASAEKAYYQHIASEKARLAANKKARMKLFKPEYIEHAVPVQAIARAILNLDLRSPQTPFEIDFLRKAIETSIERIGVMKSERVRIDKVHKSTMPGIRYSDKKGYQSREWAFGDDCQIRFTEIGLQLSVTKIKAHIKLKR